MDVERAAQFKKVNGAIRQKSSKETIYLRFDGQRRYTLQEVFIVWLYTLSQTDFAKSAGRDAV